MTKNFKFLLAHRQRYLLTAIILVAILLRFYKLGSNPPGLYWDETVFGYDAYSILKTGQDHHGNFLPLFFESFGDWKLPVYHYLLVPSIAIFGLNEFAIRFPSAFFGTLTVLLTYFLVQKLFDMPKNRNSNSSLIAHSPREALSEVEGAKRGHSSLKSVALLTTLFLAISPWHIQFSRGGFESTAGLFFVVSGIYLFLLVIDDRKKKPTFAFFLPAIALASAVLLTLSMYTYHAYRIFTPLLLAALIFIFFSEIKKNLSKILLLAFVSLIIFLPLLIFTLSPQGRLRADSQSAFQSTDFKKADLDYNQKSKKPLRFMSKYLYQKPIYYSYIALNAYVDHFSPIFLFLRGDQIGRHSQVDMGQTYVFDAFLLLFAIFAYKNMQINGRKLMVAWLLLAPIPAMIVTPTPHAYRTLQMAIPLAFFSAIGAYHFFSQKKIWPIRCLMIIIIIYYLATFLHLLFIHYPMKFSPDWQDGNRRMVQLVKEFQDKFENVYITNDGEAYIYLLFYQKYDPQKFIAEGGTKDAFGKYRFVSSDYNIYDIGRILYVSPSWQKVDGKNLANVYDTGGRLVYGIWEVGGKD